MRFRKEDKSKTFLTKDGHSRFLTSGRTVEPATLFSHSSVPSVLCVCVGAGGRLFEVKSTVGGGIDGRGATAPSRV